MTCGVVSMRVSEGMNNQDREASSRRYRRPTARQRVQRSPDGSPPQRTLILFSPFFHEDAESLARLAPKVEPDRGDD